MRSIVVSSSGLSLLHLLICVRLTPILRYHAKCAPVSISVLAAGILTAKHVDAIHIRFSKPRYVASDSWLTD